MTLIQKSVLIDSVKVIFLYIIILFKFNALANTEKSPQLPAPEPYNSWNWMEEFFKKDEQNILSTTKSNTEQWQYTDKLGRTYAPSPEVQKETVIDNSTKFLGRKLQGKIKEWDKKIRNVFNESSPSKSQDDDSLLSIQLLENSQKNFRLSSKIRQDQASLFLTTNFLNLYSDFSLDKDNSFGLKKDFANIGLHTDFTYFFESQDQRASLEKDLTESFRAKTTIRNENTKPAEQQFELIFQKTF